MELRRVCQSTVHILYMQVLYITILLKFLSAQTPADDIPLRVFGWLAISLNVDRKKKGLSHNIMIFKLKKVIIYVLFIPFEKVSL